MTISTHYNTMFNKEKERKKEKNRKEKRAVS